MPSLRRAPVRFSRASGNASHSRVAWWASASAPCSGSGVSGSSYWKPSAHRGSNPAGSRPDHARSHSSNSSSTFTLGGLQVLRHPSFRNLFFGQAASAIGDRIVYVALALYVTDIGSPSDVGLVLAAHALPMVGFLLLGGVWADRLSRDARDDLHRPRALRAARAAGRPDLHRRGRDLAHRRDRGAVRDRRGVLQAGADGARAADRARGRDPGRRARRPGRWRPSRSSRARRWRPRWCSASARAGRSRSTR